MKVKITAHKGILCFETQPPFDQDDTFIPSGDGRIGCVLVDTKANLGVSQEALNLLKTIRTNRDAIGDVMWWLTDDGKFAFGWLGGPLALKDPKECEGDRDYKVRDGGFTLIPNDVPEGAKQAIG